MIAIALPIMLLMACGGGGSSTSVVITPETLPAYTITDMAATRTRIGGTPVSMTETEIINAIQAIATAADTLRIGDTVEGGFAGIGSDIKSNCSGKSCTASVPNVDTLTFSLTDIEDLSLVDDTANLVGFDSESRVVMEDNGITFVESRSAARQDDGTKLTFQTYGGWLAGSAFGVNFLNVTEGATITNRFTSSSFGNASGSNPAGTGRAEWTGSTVGIDTDNGSLWQADVTVDIDDLSNPSVDIVISRGNYANETTRPFADLSWNDMSLTNGIFQFSSNDTNIWGSFYGDNHGEVGGAFDDHGTVGAFGATRQ